MSFFFFFLFFKLIEWLVVSPDYPNYWLRTPRRRIKNYILILLVSTCTKVALAAHAAEDVGHL